MRDSCEVYEKMSKRRDIYSIHATNTDRVQWQRARQRGERVGLEELLLIRLYYYTYLCEAHQTHMRMYMSLSKVVVQFVLGKFCSGASLCVRNV